MGPVMIRMAYRPLYIEKIEMSCLCMDGQTKSGKKCSILLWQNPKYLNRRLLTSGRAVVSLWHQWCWNGMACQWCQPTGSYQSSRWQNSGAKKMAEVSTRKNIHPLSQHLRSCRSPPPLLDSLWLSSSLSFHASDVRLLRFWQHLSHHTN